MRLYIIGCIVAVASAFFWIYKRHKMNKSYIENNDRYTKLQLFGIAGIILFMFPISWIILAQLSKGLILLLFLFFGFLHLPDSISNILISFYQLISLFFIIIGSYLVCEIIWPKKQHT